MRALRANVDVTAASGTEARRLAERRQLDAARQTLSQRALATTRVTWNTRSTQYTTVIALLAAALFFVGYALVVEGPLRPYSYGLGVATAVFAAGWAAWIFHLPIPETPPRAISAAARATVLSADGRPREAVAGFSRAIAPTATTGPRSWGAHARGCRRPTRTTRSAARSPTVTAGRRVWRSTMPSAPRSWTRARISSGPASSRCRPSIVGDMDKALAATDRALAINPHVPDVWLLRGAAHLARGDRRAADAALARGLALATAGGASERARHLAATALSELAWVARHEPSRAADARRAADRVVATETALTLRRAVSGTPALARRVRQRHGPALVGRTAAPAPRLEAAATTDRGDGGGLRAPAAWRCVDPAGRARAVRHRARHGGTQDRRVGTPRLPADRGPRRRLPRRGARADAARARRGADVLTDLET